jgi:hypothetical protein
MPIYGSLRNYLGPVLPSSDGPTLVLNTTLGGNMLSILVRVQLCTRFAKFSRSQLVGAFSSICGVA